MSMFEIALKPSEWAQMIQNEVSNMVGVYNLVDGIYQVQQFKEGDAIASSIFPKLRLTAAEILTVTE
jgi:Uma2 family endonuclease